MQLTPDLHQMHSSFDLGESSYQGYRTSRHFSDFSFRSGQHDQYHSFQDFNSNFSDQYGHVGYERNDGMRTSYSVASLDCGKVYSVPSVDYKDLSFNSSGKFQKKNKQNNQNKGVRKRCPAQQEDQKLFTIKIDDIIEGKDKRTTLMIKNIPNKYTSKLLTGEINVKNKNRYNFFYLPIDFK